MNHPRVVSMFSAVVLLLTLAGPLMVPLFGFADPDESVGGAFSSPGQGAPLGTDRLGESVLSGVLTGGLRLTLAALLVGFLVTTLSVVIGGIAALHPRMRPLVDLLSDGTLLIPPVLVLLLVPVLFPNAGLGVLIGICVALGLPFTVKVAFSALDGVAQRGFVAAAVDSGESTFSVLRTDLVPPAASLLRSLLGLRIVEALYLLSVASFLGVDSGLGDHSWSTMVHDGVEGVLLNPWAVSTPAFMLAVTGATIFSLTHGKDSISAEAAGNAI